MYLILNNSDVIVDMTPFITYVKNQSNNTTIMTGEVDATAVYSSSSDKFYSIKQRFTGDVLYSVVQVEKIPTNVSVNWMFKEGKFLEPTVTTQIKTLKEKLTETDYKIIKCSEYQLIGSPAPYDIAQLHATRQVFRDEINKLENLANQV